jgi:hypothetical protein
VQRVVSMTSTCVFPDKTEYVYTGQRNRNGIRLFF